VLNGPADVLIIEDSATWQQVVRASVESAGHVPVLAGTAAEALRILSARSVDLILLDLGLPDADGVELCRQLRSSTDAYILILSAKDAEMDRVVGLTVGADDYMTKPFSARELAARINALLRRRNERPTTATPDTPTRVHGDLVLDVGARTVTVAGGRVELTRIEFDLLDALTERPRMVWTREQLQERVWGPDHFGAPNLVDTHVGNLRKKVDRDGSPRTITTVRGVGYRLSD